MIALSSITLDKANIVIDTFSCKFMGSLAHISKARRPLIEEIHRLEVDGIKFEIKKPKVFLADVEL